jgi:FAD/FMN-containing dehydrogenase
MTTEPLLAGEISDIGGELLTDLVSRRAVARDVGGLVSMLPRAVVRPKSIEDVVRAVRFCNRQGIRVVARGRGHTTLGQAQVDGGVVLDMTALGRIHSMSNDRVVVDAGATWRQLLVEAMQRGRTPPVLTGFQGLSIGGTLSAGGISGTSYKRGAQVDHVIDLEVVTGDGRIVTCSAESNHDLFDAVLAGEGRYAVIVRATLRLVPAPARARHTLLGYASLAPFLGDLRELVRRGELDGVSGTICLEHGGSVRYELNALSFFTPPALPDTPALLRDVGSEASGRTTEFEYIEYCLLVDALLEQLSLRGSWDGIAHPWFDVFLPDEHVQQFVAETIGALDASMDVGPPELASLGQLHLFPLQTRHLKRPLLRVPHGELVFLFDVLTSARARGSHAGFARRMLDRNRRLFEGARQLGGTRYSISAIPFSRADHIHQLGPDFTDFERRKSKYDPGRILGGCPNDAGR